MLKWSTGRARACNSSTGRFFYCDLWFVSSVCFILSIGLVVTPFIHRQLHKWHLEEGLAIILLVEKIKNNKQTIINNEELLLYK